MLGLATEQAQLRAIRVAVHSPETALGWKWIPQPRVFHTGCFRMKLLAHRKEKSIAEQKMREPASNTLDEESPLLGEFS